MFKRVSIADITDYAKTHPRRVCIYSISQPSIFPVFLSLGLIWQSFFCPISLASCALSDVHHICLIGWQERGVGCAGVEEEFGVMGRGEGRREGGWKGSRIREKGVGQVWKKSLG